MSHISHSMIFHESAKDSYGILIYKFGGGTNVLRFIAVYRTPSCSARELINLIKAINELACVELDTYFSGISTCEIYEIASRQYLKNFSRCR